jgi:hypothetical protein
MIWLPLKWDGDIPARPIRWRNIPPFRGEKLADLLPNDFNELRLLSNVLFGF